MLLQHYSRILTNYYYPLVVYIMHSSFISSTNCFYLFLISLKYSLIDFMIRAVTVVFISVAKCLKSSISLPPLHSGFSFIIFYHFIFFHIQRSYVCTLIFIYVLTWGYRHDDMQLICICTFIYTWECHRPTV